MTTIREILYLHDPRSLGRAALDTAIETTRRSTARLTIAEVVEDGDAIVDLIRFDRRAALERLLESSRAQGVEAHLLQLAGRPSEAVAEAVERHGFDLVIKSHDATGDAALLRRVASPVWIVRGAETGATRVLAAVDPFAEGADAELNRAVLNRAAAIASAWDARLHVVSAWAPGGLGVLAGARRLAALEADARQGQLAELGRTGSGPLPPGCVHLEGGSPVEVISGVARRERADLIVAGTAARDGVTGMLIGNTAERLLRRAACSLLVVRADNGTALDDVREASAA